MPEMSATAVVKSQGKKNTYMAGVGSFERRWLLVDATDRPLGRLAAQVAVVLQGKHRPIYTPHLDTGDFVIVTNAVKVGISGSQEITRVVIKAELASADKAKLEASLVETVNRAIKQSQRTAAGMMSRLSGLALPDMENHA